MVGGGIENVAVQGSGLWVQSLGSLLDGFHIGTIATISRRGSWVQILDESYCQH